MELPLIASLQELLRMHSFCSQKSDKFILNLRADLLLFFLQLSDRHFSCDHSEFMIWVYVQLLSLQL